MSVKPVLPSVHDTPFRRSRLLLLIRTLGLGGMERMTVNLANALHRQGHEVHLLVFKDRIELRPDPGVQLHVVDFERIFRLTVVGALYEVAGMLLTRIAPRAKKVLGSFYFSPLFAFWLKRFERRYGPVDLMVARGYGSFDGLACFSDPRLVRVVVNEQWESPASVWHRRFFRWSFAGAKVVFNSALLEAQFHRLCDQMHVRPAFTRAIGNPTDVQQIRADAEGPSPVEPPYIISVGRLEKAKNHQLLLSAFALLKERIPHRLVLVGKGSLQPALRRQAEEFGIADRVVFAGQQQNPYPWIRHAALFVLSSLHEGLPNVVIEALVCGTPVVVTRGKGGTVELMQGALSAFVAEMDPASLAERIMAAITNPPSIEPALVENFSMTAVARAYLALLGSETAGAP